LGNAGLQRLQLGNVLLAPCGAEDAPLIQLEVGLLTELLWRALLPLQRFSSQACCLLLFLLPLLLCRVQAVRPLVLRRA
jgi:hypothetical protein